MKRTPLPAVPVEVDEARAELVAAFEKFVGALLSEASASNQSRPLTLTAAEAGELLGAHGSTVRKMVANGVLSALPGFQELRLSRVEVERYAAGEPARPVRAVS